MTTVTEDSTEVFLKPREISDKYRISVMTVYRILRTGNVPFLQIGKSIRVRESDWQSYTQKGN